MRPDPKSGLGIGTATTAATTGTFLSTRVESAIPTLLKIGAGYATSVGLETIGVDPIVSGLVSSAVTGGIHGLTTGGGLTGAFTSALQWTAQTGAMMLGYHLDIDPVITSILSMTTSSIMGVGLDSDVSIGDAVKMIAPNVAGELGYYGVQYAGEALGLNSQISYLAGIGVRSSLIAGLSGLKAADETESIIGAKTTEVSLKWTEDNDPFLNILEPPGEEVTEYRFVDEMVEFYNDNYDLASDNGFNGLELINLKVTPTEYVANYGFKLGQEFASKYGAKLMAITFTITKTFTDTISGTMYNKMSIKTGNDVNLLNLQEPRRLLDFVEIMDGFKGIVDYVYELGETGFSPTGPALQVPKPILEEALKTFTGEGLET